MHPRADDHIGQTSTKAIIALVHIGHPILQIDIVHDGELPPRLGQACPYGRSLPAVLRMNGYSKPRAGRSCSTQAFLGIITASIIDDDDLKRHPKLLERNSNLI